MTELINVRSARSDERVALWEKDDEHPGGEAYVAGSAAVQVATTSAVIRKIADGEIEVIDDEEEITDLESARRSGELVRAASAAGASGSDANPKKPTRREIAAQKKAAQAAEADAARLKAEQEEAARLAAAAENAGVEDDDDEDEDGQPDGRSSSDPGA